MLQEIRVAVEIRAHGNAAQLRLSRCENRDDSPSRRGSENLNFLVIIFFFVDVKYLYQSRYDSVPRNIYESVNREWRKGHDRYRKETDAREEKERRDARQQDQTDR